MDAVVELELRDGSMDIGWYALTLEKTDRWRVLSVSPREPQLFGRSGWMSGRDLKSIEAVLCRYAELVCKGEYKKASACLAGPARVEHERSTQSLPPGGLGKKISGITTEPLWKSGSLAAVSAEYGGQEAIVTAWESPKGWLIVNIEQGGE